MATKVLPTPEVLRQLLRYEPETGNLFWRDRGPEWFADGCEYAGRACKGWNTYHAGKAALTAISRKGYRHGRILYRAYMAHRVAWCIVHGVWPDQIDHISGIKDDNRIENLRNVSNAENLKNQKIRSTNTSGFIGICWSKGRGKWQAQISVDSCQLHLGFFAHIADAVASRDAAEIEHGYHANHGRNEKKGPTP